MAKDRFRRSKRVREILEAVEECGYRVAAVNPTRGGHVCVLVTDGVRKRKVFTGFSPSCRRALRNFQQNVRTAMREAQDATA